MHTFFALQYSMVDLHEFCIVWEVSVQSFPGSYWNLHHTLQNSRPPSARLSRPPLPCPPPVSHISGSLPCRGVSKQLPSKLWQ